MIYQGRTTTGPLYLFAPPGDNMFVSSTTYFFPSPGQGRALFTSVGADGQRGMGHDDTNSGESTLFDSIAVAGPGTNTGSDWDGSDGLTLPQLWDTHTHEVFVSNAVSRVDYSSPDDCLVPVDFVLDME